MTLPYGYSDLEPYIDALTVETHYDKHHRGYVAKLNQALESHSDLLEMSIEDLLKNLNKIPDEKKIAVINNGGQVYNHNLYWESITPNGGGEPAGELAEKINESFGSFNQFKADFSNTATTQFGSGWAWLSLDSKADLVISSTSNADSPLLHGMTPIMTMDVWEHAYYLKYKNLRPSYIEAFWNLVNWEEIAKKYNATK